jgi:hypothetical protein
MNKILNAIIMVLTSIIALAILSVILSKSTDLPGIIQGAEDLLTSTLNKAKTS